MNTQYNELTLLSKSEAAKLIHIGKETLNDLIENGELGVIALGGRVKIPYAEIQRFISNRTIYVNNKGKLVDSDKKNIPEELLDEFDSTKIFEKITEGEK